MNRSLYICVEEWGVSVHLLQAELPFSDPLPPTDDDAFEPAEVGTPPAGDSGGEGAPSQGLEQPLPPGPLLTELEDSVDSSSALLVPPDPTPNGSASATEALPGGRHNHNPLNTVV